MSERVSERIIRTTDGEVLLEGVQSVGINQSYSFSDVYGYHRNGFPSVAPEMRICGKELFWAAVAQSKNS